MSEYVWLAPFAYIDPSAGSLVLQVILGGLAGLAVAARLVWRRAITRLRGSSEPDDVRSAADKLEGARPDDVR